MMKKTMKALTLATLALGLTACDGTLTDERRTERDEARYQKAMTEYKAGHLKQAVDELEDALRGNPGNLSARFILASLQYERKDNLGAFCNFREYLQLSPKGEKAEMARQRMALCEEGLAKELAKKMKLTDNAAIAQESDSVRKELQDSEKTLARLNGDLEAARRQIASLERENARLRRMIGSVGAEEAEEAKEAKDSDDLRSLLATEDDAATPPTPRVADGEADGASPVAAHSLAAVKELISDAEDARGPASLPAQTAGATGATKGADRSAGGLPFGRGRSRNAKDAGAAPDRPGVYVVQEGDTLYKIALRFYGNQNEWRRIREANKATISNDGRVNAGQKIVLP